VFIAGANEVTLRNHKDVYELLKRGAEKRRTAATLMNISSRFYQKKSQLIFMVSILI
jgi:hypothetical protein